MGRIFRGLVFFDTGMVLFGTGSPVAKNTGIFYCGCIF